MVLKLHLTLPFFFAFRKSAPLEMEARRGIWAGGDDGCLGVVYIGNNFCSFVYLASKFLGHVKYMYIQLFS